MNHTEFIYGVFDTTFVENRFAMQERGKGELVETAAIAAALVAHERRQQALTTLAEQQSHTTSKWKMAGRQEAVGR
jgi:hypothetical protein